MTSILGAGSPLNKFELIEAELSRNSKTVFVDLTGNDLTGDGSSAKPFKTVARAMSEDTGTILELTISLNAGDHKTDSVLAKNVNVIFTGLGRLDFATTGDELLSIDGCTVSLLCDLVDTSVGAYGRFAIFSNGGLIIGTGVNVSLTKAAAFLVIGWGQNSYSANGSIISSDAAIAKITNYSNTESISMFEGSVTYTNIT